MDLVPVLSTVIFVATIATMILAVFSYAAFKFRDSRKPTGPEEKPIFFHRFELPGENEDPEANPG